MRTEQMRGEKNPPFQKKKKLHMLECDTEIGPSVFMNLLEHNQ